MTGFLGSHTTFSTFTFETHALVDVGDYGPPFANIVVSDGIGLTATWLGTVIGRA